MKPIQGSVVSVKMSHTVTVEVKRQTAHPLYHKRIWLKKKYHAHNELDCKVGDRVKITETRPLSKTKRWQVIEILSAAKTKSQSNRTGNQKPKVKK